MLMAVQEPLPRAGWMVRWINGCHRAQVYPIGITTMLPFGVQRWKFPGGVCAIALNKGDALEAARELMERSE